MYKVIDISVNQKIDSIDFERIKESGVRGVIVRAGYGNTAAQKDNNFDYFINEAKKASHKVGAYWFCYARSADEAAREADACAEVLDGMNLDYPVVYDIEGDTVRYMNDNGIEATSELISDIAIAFADRMTQRGYGTMLYSNENFVYNYFDKRLTVYPLWVAMYPDNPDTDTQYTMDGWNVAGWQYTSTDAGINGAPSHLDVSVFYDDCINGVSEECENNYNQNGDGENMTRHRAEIYVQTCFTEYLGRPADPEALEAYSNAIIDRNEDDDLSDVDRALQNSDEYKRNFIIKCYQVHLGRDPESEEVIQAKMGYPRLRDILADILNSEEYQNIHN